MVMVSPNIDSDSLPMTPMLDDKIRIFEDRTKGWMLDIADRALSDIPHAGYAALSIVFSYYEMIGTCRAGYTGSGQSRTHFKQGFQEVHPIPDTNLAQSVMNELYERVRCGLYHVGMTRVGIFLTGDMPAMFSYRHNNKDIVINPHRVLPNIQAHFRGFVSDLRDRNNGTLRQNFETWYDS